MATIIKRESASGDVSYQAKIRRVGYPSQSETFDKRSDAVAWARKVEGEMDSGSFRDVSAVSITFHTLIEDYILRVVPLKKGAKIEALRLRTLQKDDLAKYKLTNLTSAVLRKWRDRRLLAGAAGSTINRELNVISALFNWAIKECDMPVVNPVAGVKRPQNPRSRDRRLEGDEEARLLAALTESAAAGDKKYRVGTKNTIIRPLVEFALETAMRKSELVGRDDYLPGLRWDLIDMEKQTAFLEDTKNGESRTVPLSRRAVAILEALEPEEESRVGKVFKVSGDAVKKAFERACQRAGVGDFHFHDLRHEATSRLSLKLPNLIELAAVTGHKDLRSLQRYYHPRTNDLVGKIG